MVKPSGGHGIGSAPTVRITPGDPIPGQSPNRVKGPVYPVIPGYEIIGVLGQGGMGVVYKASQIGLDSRPVRIVALKMIQPGVQVTADDLDRFNAEIRVVARLNDENIVRIFAVGEQNGLPYFAMEYVEGGSLAGKVAGQPQPPDEAAGLLQVLARAMHKAHEAGIIHRDLKPANVLVTTDGIPKITDFGLAKQLDSDSLRTASEAIMGTPCYMSPEQAKGKTAAVREPTDIYALGAILYDLLTGRPPFKGSTTLDTLDLVRNEEPVPPSRLVPKLPRDLETICLKCLEKDPERRFYKTAQELAADLQRYLERRPILARPVSAPERLRRLALRNKKVASLSATVALLVLAWAVTSSLLAGWLQVARVEAVANERVAKKTADVTLDQMHKMASLIAVRIQTPRLMRVDDPAYAQVVQLRSDLIELIRNTVTLMSEEIEKAGATKFARAAACQLLGDVEAKLGQSTEALKLYEEGRKLVQLTVDEEPQNDLARANLGVCLMLMGDVERELKGDARRALDGYYRQANHLQREILNHPRNGNVPEADRKKNLSHVNNHMGQALLSLGDPAAAYRCFQESLAHRQAWAKSLANPRTQDDLRNFVSAHSYVVEAHLWLGIVASHLGNAKGVHDHFGQALGMAKSLIQEWPEDTSFKSDLAEVQGAYGDALLRLDKVEEAETNYLGSRDILKLVIDRNGGGIPDVPLLALALERLGNVCTRLGKDSEAGGRYQMAWNLRQTWLQLVPTSLPRQAADLLASALDGKHAEAAQGAAALRPKVGQSTELLLQVAHCYAVCAARDASKKAQYVQGAMESLRAATAQDYKDHVLLQTDPYLEAIRAEPAFQATLAEVKARPGGRS